MQFISQGSFEMPQIKIKERENKSHQTHQAKATENPIVLIEKFLNSSEQTLEGIAKRYNDEKNTNKNKNDLDILEHINLLSDIELDIETIYCQKTGQPIGKRFPENIAKMQAFLGDDKFKSVAKYIPLTNGFACHWLFTNRENLHKLLTEDPKGFFIFAISRVLEHKHKDLRDNIEKLAQWENSKARGYARLEKEHIDSGKLIAANQTLRHFLSLNPNLFSWPENLPEDFCTNEQLENIHEKFGAKVAQLLKRKRIKSEQELVSFSQGQGKGYSDMRIGAGQKIKEESPHEQVLRLLAGIKIKGNQDLYLFKKEIVASEDGISRKAKSILGLRPDIEKEINEMNRRAKLNVNNYSGKMTTYEGKDKDGKKKGFTFKRKEG